MERNVGYWLQRAARLHRQKTAEAVQDLGLFPGQEQMLMVLARGELHTVGDLAEALDVRPPTVSKTLQRLAAQKLVERGEHGEDARRSTISLSEEGARRAKELVSRIKRVEKELVQDLDSKEERRLRKLLRRTARSMAPAKNGDAPAEDEMDSEES